MGNVVSVVLVYALQAAWMCQRIIDRDFSQNHGSRPKPIAEETTETMPEPFLPKSSPAANGCSTRNPHRRHGKPVKSERQRKNVPSSDRFFASDAKEKTRHRKRRFDRNLPVSEFRELGRNFDSDSESYLEFRNGLTHRLGHRRAFSDFDNDYVFASNENRPPNRTTDDNHNVVDDERADETAISTVDQELLRLVLSRGCTGEKHNDFSAYSVL